MRATSFGGAPLLSKICQAISLSTESKALVQHTNVQILAFVPSLIAQKAQAEQGVNSAPAWSEATLLVKKVVCERRALSTLA